MVAAAVARPSSSPPLQSLPLLVDVPPQPWWPPPLLGRLPQSPVSTPYFRSRTRLCWPTAVQLFSEAPIQEVPAAGWPVLLEYTIPKATQTCNACKKQRRIFLRYSTTCENVKNPHPATTITQCICPHSHVSFFSCISVLKRNFKCVIVFEVVPHNPPLWIDIFEELSCNKPENSVPQLWPRHDLQQCLKKILMIWKKDDKSKRPLLWTHPLEINLFPNNHFDTPHENAVLYIKIPPPRIFYFKPTTRKWKNNLAQNLVDLSSESPFSQFLKRDIIIWKPVFADWDIQRKAIPKSFYSCEIQGIFSIIKWNTKLPKLYP